MRYELTDVEWTATRPMLPNKPRGVPRMNDRRVLNGILRRATTNSPPTTLPSSNSRQFGSGYALMSPRPKPSDGLAGIEAPLSTVVLVVLQGIGAARRS
jgi:hypothetical protein